MIPDALATKIARTMAVLILIVVVVLMLTVVSFGLYAKTMAELVPSDSPHKMDLSGLTLGLQAALFPLIVIPAATYCWGLLGLRRTFLEAADGRTFSTPAVSGFRRFAVVSLIVVCANVIIEPAIFAIFTYADPNQPGSLAINFGSEEIEAIFNSVLVFFAAHVFVLAKKTKDENDAFI